MQLLFDRLLTDLDYWLTCDQLCGVSDCNVISLFGRLMLCFLSQVGRRGHCSVEDAHAALDLYKLVEGEWERELQDELQDDDASKHYMQDEYWPDHVITDIQ